ncbi:MAG: hypothetical protein M4579_006600 [Chaenotheca gracillima]|nr:MAG: hypothetical protein M4579_006600 [Chaenotheca gracillima]
MNSLNILSARVIGATPSAPQTPTEGPQDDPKDGDDREGDSSPPLYEKSALQSYFEKASREAQEDPEDDEGRDNAFGDEDEKSPLLPEHPEPFLQSTKPTGWGLIPRQLVDALIQSIKWVLSTLTAPGVYIIGCLYDDRGAFSPLLPARKIKRAFPRRSGRRSTAQAVGISAATEGGDPAALKRSHRRKLEISKSSEGGDSSTAVLTSDSEPERDETPSYGEADGDQKVPRHTRSISNSSASSEESSPNRRSIRIKLYNEDAQQKQRRSRKSSSQKGSSSGAAASQDPSTSLSPNALKSPTSPNSPLKLTRYPRGTAPPRPLIPRRQPSYVFQSTYPNHMPQKTLILDLDETLIHSLAKGGRMSTGHMVEVKLNAPVGFSGGVAMAPQHPILYYVHKRPNCDEFLRKVCKWYNLVAFTASVQEYADPVIEWLEQDRKYFSARYYRQHCTFRGGNYIKDISSVEPDLSKVMIIDNSPTSYIFHEDNAIPIEGWISDPTDNDLLHLIPLLEALQYVTDVRALLALRTGESTSVPSSASPSSIRAPPSKA